MSKNKQRKHAASTSSILESSSVSNYDGLQYSVRKNGRFINPWSSWKSPSTGETVKALLFTKNNGGVPSKEELNTTLPILPVDPKELAKPPENGIRVTWLGHSTILVQMDGINILTDPIFSARCSPVQFFGTKRYRRCACTVHDLPPVHAVLISNAHYDHLDSGSVQLLNARFGSDTRWFVPLGLASWMHRAHCVNVIEMDWWDENCIPEFPNMRFVLTPSMHASRRTATTANKILWGSWCVLGPRHKFFFVGGTGYCHAFEQIGRQFGPFDLAALPIGAYEPRWYQRSSHVNPREAVRLHRDLRARRSVAVHWGTFALGSEFYLEPREKLTQLLWEKNIDCDDFVMLSHGQSRLFTD